MTPLATHPQYPALLGALADIGCDRQETVRVLDDLGPDGAMRALCQRLELDSLDQLDCALALEALAGVDLGRRSETLFERGTIAQALDAVASSAKA